MTQIVLSLKTKCNQGESRAGAYLPCVGLSAPSPLLSSQYKTFQPIKLNVSLSLCVTSEPTKVETRNPSIAFLAEAEKKLPYQWRSVFSPLNVDIFFGRKKKLKRFWVVTAASQQNASIWFLPALQFVMIVRPWYSARVFVAIISWLTLTLPGVRFLPSDRLNCNLYCWVGEGGREGAGLSWLVLVVNSSHNSGLLYSLIRSYIILNSPNVKTKIKVASMTF